MAGLRFKNAAHFQQWLDTSNVKLMHDLDKKAEVLPVPPCPQRVVAPKVSRWRKELELFGLALVISLGIFVVLCFIAGALAAPAEPLGIDVPLDCRALQCSRF